MSMEEHVPSWVTDQSTLAAAEKAGFWTVIRHVHVRQIASNFHICIYNFPSSNVMGVSQPSVYRLN